MLTICSLSCCSSDGLALPNDSSLDRDQWTLSSHPDLAASTNTPGQCKTSIQVHHGNVSRTYRLWLNVFHFQVGYVQCHWRTAASTAYASSLTGLLFTLWLTLMLLQDLLQTLTRLLQLPLHPH